MKFGKQGFIGFKDFWSALLFESQGIQIEEEAGKGYVSVCLTPPVPPATGAPNSAVNDWSCRPGRTPGRSCARAACGRVPRACRLGPARTWPQSAERRRGPARAVGVPAVAVAEPGPAPEFDGPATEAGAASRLPRPEGTPGGQ